ncbi:extracellular solute-binding protein [Arthrobacter sp. NPDC080031]|uniref:ABC transporter substrate-binding protein n=1 Tax=Arthrobacter sp. NPDC080031 TaxID=3155918 RepID=UPI0034505656
MKLKNKSAMIAVTAMAACAALSLSACGGQAAGSAAGQASSTATGAAGSDQAPFVLYSAMGYDAPVVKAFTAATGIQVKLVDDSTGPLLTKIAAEKNNPQWTAFWADGDTAFASLDQQGQLLPYTPAASYTPAGQSVVPGDHSYIPTGVTTVPAVIYNAAKTAAVPTSLADLSGSQYTGKVGMNDPSQSGPTYPLIAGVMNQLGGVDQGKKMFSDLKSNGMKVYPTNGDTLHALETGQIQYGMIQSSAALAEVLKVKPTADFQPKVASLSASTLLPGVFGIDKNAPATAQEQAKKFADFLLSPAGQEAMKNGNPNGDSLFWPIISGITPAAGVPSFPAGYQHIDPSTWGPRQADIVSWFDSNIK